MSVIKIAIIGPECSGKTTLCEQLSAHFQEPWVPEFARNYLAHVKQHYVEEDLIAIAQGQLHSEQQTLTLAKQFLFCDTDLSNIQVWSEVKFDRCATELLQLVSQQYYDAYILLTNQTTWEFDDLRESPNLETREVLYQTYLDMTLATNKPLLIYNRDHWQKVVDFITSLPFH